MKNIFIGNSSISSGNAFQPVELQESMIDQRVVEHVENLGATIISSGEKRKRDEEMAENSLKRRQVEVFSPDQPEKMEEEIREVSGKEEDLEELTQIRDSGGSIYEGGIRCGKREGKGRLTSADGLRVCEGIFQNNDFIEGTYSYRSPDGTQILTVWKQGKAAYQICKHADSSIYVGEDESEEGLSHGISIETNQQIYAGSKKGDTIQDGVMIFPVGSNEKSVVFQDGKPVAEVSCEPGNLIYEGEIACGDAIHYGKLTELARQKIYTGTLRNYTPDGVGMMEDQDNGTLYIGHWKGGVYEGEGTLVNSKGAFSSYKGEFKKNLFHGYGEIQLQQGSVYRGYWKNGLQHGLGCMRQADGKLDGGVWEDGRFSYFDLQGNTFFISGAETQSDDDIAGSDFSDESYFSVEELSD